MIIGAIIGIGVVSLIFYYCLPKKKKNNFKSLRRALSERRNDQLNGNLNNS